MKHPNPMNQKYQEDFLNQCPEDMREYHARIFRIGNVAYRYHQLAATPSNEVLESYYAEWLEGLPANIREDMKKKGFNQCKTMFPFTRYVNEREDVGMEAWMKENLSEKDYEAYHGEKSNE